MTPPRPRRMTRADIAPLAQLWHAAWHETHAPFVPDSLIALRTADDFRDRIVALDDRVRTIGPTGAPVGFCAIRGNQMYQLFISPAARGTGAGEALIKDAEDRMRANGVTRAHLDCLPQNSAAIRFYAKMGWVPAGVQNVMLDSKAGPFAMDCMVFTKKLDD